MGKPSVSQNTEEINKTPAAAAAAAAGQATLGVASAASEVPVAVSAPESQLHHEEESAEIKVSPLVEEEGEDIQKILEEGSGGEVTTKDKRGRRNRGSSSSSNISGGAEGNRRVSPAEVAPLCRQETSML